MPTVKPDAAAKPAAAAAADKPAPKPCQAEGFHGDHRRPGRSCSQGGGQAEERDQAGQLNPASGPLTPIPYTSCVDRARRLPSAAAMLNTVKNKASRPEESDINPRGKRPWSASGSSNIRPACPPISTSPNTRRWSSCLEESFAKFADRKAFICMDKSISYRELDEMSQALGAYLQSRGLQKGARVALMMPNVLQYPIATAGRAARRLRGRQRQSALHPARARASADGFRRRSHHRAGEFCRHRREGDGQDRAQARHRRQHGRSARPQGHDRQPGGAAGQEDGAALCHPARHRLQSTRSPPAVA